MPKKHVNAFLADFEIKKQVTLRAELIEQTSRREPSHDETFEWPHRSYAWITIQNVPGGTDVSCRTIEDEHDPDDAWWRLNQLRTAPNHSTASQKRVEAARNHNIYWSFRRSAGQPAFIALAYGLIAASLAELTDGLVFSGDNAWDYAAFPATGPEFRAVYFRPDITNQPDRADWVKRCIAALQSGEL